MRANDWCLSCGAPMRWALSKSTGRPMPLDAASNENGNLAVVEWSRGTTAAFPTPVVAINPTRQATLYRYLKHVCERNE